MAQGWQVRWLGTADRMEADLVPKHGIEIDFIRISGLAWKRYKSTDSCAGAHFLPASGATSVKRYKPDVVLGMGGYVSGRLVVWPRGR